MRATRQPTPDLLDAIQEWTVQLEAYMSESYRIAGGGTVDLLRLEALRYRVNKARRRCEDLVRR